MSPEDTSWCGGQDDNDEGDLRLREVRLFDDDGRCLGEDPWYLGGWDPYSVADASVADALYQLHDEDPQAAGDAYAAHGSLS